MGQLHHKKIPRTPLLHLCIGAADACLKYGDMISWRRTGMDGARWPWRTSNPVYPPKKRMGGFDSHTFPPLFFLCRCGWQGGLGALKRTLRVYVSRVYCGAYSHTPLRGRNKRFSEVGTGIDGTLSALGGCLFFKSRGGVTPPLRNVMAVF